MNKMANITFPKNQSEIVLNHKDISDKKGTLFLKRFDTEFSKDEYDLVNDDSLNLSNSDIAEIPCDLPQSFEEKEQGKTCLGCQIF